MHLQDIGLSTSSDTAIIQYARMNNQTICTLDADFHALLAVSGSDTPSVIRIRREGLRGPDVANLLLAGWRAIEPAVASGALITITETAVRIRRLPIVREHREKS